MSNKKSSSSGCFASIFRRLLCSGSPQTHPSDHITETKPVDNAAKVHVQATENGPGIVARLMGLDSLPEKNWGIGQVTRSRSVNFVDYMLDSDSTQASTHRRVKTSTSFREMLLVPQGPAQLLQQNQIHELLVEPSSKQKENVKKEEHQEKNKKISKLKNEPRARSVSCKQSLKSSPLKKVEYSEVSSSSPVSVLNVNDFEKKFELNYKEETVYYMELMDKPCKLTEKDINFSNWITEKGFEFEDFEDICMEFEEQILDLMLHQVANELVGFSHMYKRPYYFCTWN